MKFNHTKIENVWQIVDYIDNENIFFINTNKNLCCFSNGVIIEIYNKFKSGIIQKWNSPASASILLVPTKTINKQNYFLYL